MNQNHEHQKAFKENKSKMLHILEATNLVTNKNGVFATHHSRGMGVGRG